MNPNPYSFVDNSWYNNHDNDGFNGAVNNKYRDYFSILMGTYLLTSGGGNNQTPLTRLRRKTHQRRRRAAESLSPGVLDVALAGAFLLRMISAMAPLPCP